MQSAATNYALCYVNMSVMMTCLIEGLATDLSMADLLKQSLQKRMENRKPKSRKET